MRRFMCGASKTIWLIVLLLVIVGVVGGLLFLDRKGMRSEVAVNADLVTGATSDGVDMTSPLLSATNIVSGTVADVTVDHVTVQLDNQGKRVITTDANTGFSKETCRVATQEELTAPMIDDSAPSQVCQPEGADRSAVTVGSHVVISLRSGSGSIDVAESVALVQ